jgi:hypothetical protein
MDREAGIMLSRISLLARLAECALSTMTISEVEEALQLIKTLSNDLANQLNCMAEEAGVMWSESDYAGL